MLQWITSWHIYNYAHMQTNECLKVEQRECILENLRGPAKLSYKMVVFMLASTMDACKVLYMNMLHLHNEE